MPDIPYVDAEKLTVLNDKVKEHGNVDREHLMEFMECMTTNDAKSIIGAVHAWLSALHEDKDFDKVTFPKGDIDAVIGDLDSYGRVQAHHILEYKQKSNKTLPIS